MIKTLLTQRLKLRPIEQADAGVYYAVDRFQDAGVVSGLGGVKNLEMAGKQVAGLVRINQTGLSFHWTLQLLPAGPAIGFCNAFLPAPQLIGMGCCEISYSLLKAYQGQGLMREALSAVIDFMLREKRFFRVEALVSPTNTASIALLEKLGFAQEGLQRKKFLLGNQRHDMLGMALLADA